MRPNNQFVLPFDRRYSVSTPNSKRIVHRSAIAVKLAFWKPDSMLLRLTTVPIQGHTTPI
jgi:hypothetical protein